jgi:hypothetical protein
MRAKWLSKYVSDAEPSTFISDKPTKSSHMRVGVDFIGTLQTEGC